MHVSVSVCLCHVCVCVCVCVCACLYVCGKPKLNVLSFGRFLSSSAQEALWITSFLVS